MQWHRNINNSMHVTAAETCHADIYRKDSKIVSSPSVCFTHPLSNKQFVVFLTNLQGACALQHL